MKKHVLTIDIDKGTFTDAAYTVHAKRFYTNAAQLLLASNVIQERVGVCTSITWYMQGMALELLLKGLLYKHDRTKYSLNYFKKVNHNLERLLQLASKEGVVAFTPNHLHAVSQLNEVYFDREHALRYPSLLSIFTEIKPDEKYEKLVVEVIDSLMEKASDQFASAD